LKELLTTYWSQTTLVILLSSYFIKRIFDNRSKKLEINHSLFQQNRIDAINRFFSIYAEVQLMWQQLNVYPIFLKEKDLKEIDAMLLPPLNRLAASQLELKIYFKANKYDCFEDLIKNMLSINEELMRLYLLSESEKKIVDKVSDYKLFINDITKKADVTLDKLIERIRSINYNMTKF
jgi:hypothetical protein